MGFAIFAITYDESNHPSISLKAYLERHINGLNEHRSVFGNSEQVQDYEEVKELINVLRDDIKAKITEYNRFPKESSHYVALFRDNDLNRKWENLGKSIRNLNGFISKINDTNYSPGELYFELDSTIAKYESVMEWIDETFNEDASA